jgi:hypothetical protein
MYNLRRLEDFNGVYGQARTGWALGQQGKARRQGLSLTPGADGMLVRLGA